MTRLPQQLPCAGRPSLSISLDGFVAGPDQRRDNPLGVGGLELHRWHLDEPVHEADARARDELMKPCGAYVMGRNMFGPVRGPWDVKMRVPAPRRRAQ